MLRKFYRKSIRVKIAVSSILSLCAASCTSTFLVYGGIRLFHQGEITIGLAHLVMSLITLMTILIGGGLMIILSKRISEPIVHISLGVAQVSKGNLQMIPETMRMDEIGELARNYNRMVQELTSMEYMNKEFMHNVSHELKTPIAAITGFSECLLDGGLEEEQAANYLNCIYDEAIRLSHLCENMLRLTRVENQGIVINKKSYSLDEQLRRCIILIHEKWEEKEIEYELDLCKCEIETDYELMQQVWLNLIDNAVKFSMPRGKILVTMKIKQQMVEIKITDFGIGIPKDKISRIFDRFYQCEESHSKAGYGLGLAIVKRIVELCEGEISCESVKEQGTSFCIRLHIT